jgi:tetratricopeptide (TPR) repeat protein
MSDVFISHVEEDKNVALEIARALNAAGYTTWCYEGDSDPGVSYLTQIGEAIEACQAVVVVISPESLGSDQVTREVEFSHDSRKPFVPVLKGISHVEFQHRRATWRVALGTAASIPVPPEGAPAIVPRIVRGLQGLGVKPAERARAEAWRLAQEKVEQEERENAEAARRSAEKERSEAPLPNWGVGKNADAEVGVGAGEGGRPRGAPLRRGWTAAAAALVLLIALGAVFYFRPSHPQPPLTEKDTIVLADFINKTGDPVFDDTLKQALAVALRQSPFLNVLSDNQVADTLRSMEHPADTSVTGEVAREACQRAGSRAYIAGSIAALGSQYVLGLKAVGCAAGETLAEEQATAAGKENVVNALGQEAAKLREELGESLASVQKLDTPLAQATTPSLEALKAYSRGAKATGEGRDAAALPHFQRAIELDPSFASAHAQLGVAYSNLGQTARARECISKAFALRERTSEWEKVYVTASYYDLVTGELRNSVQAYQEWIENYPRASAPYVSLSIVRLQEGNYAECAELNRQALLVRPNYVNAYDNMGSCLMNLGRLDEARKTFAEATSRKLDDSALRLSLYDLDFLAGDTQGMASQAAWFQGNPDLEHVMIAAEADTEAYGGHLARARELTRRAVDGAVSADNPEAAAGWRLNAAMREAAFGNATEARREAQAALKLAPDSRDVQRQAAFAGAWAGDEVGARRLAADLKTRFPLDTVVNSYWLPTIEARIMLAEKNPAGALDRLQALSSPLELAPTNTNGADTYPAPVYTRAEAYLAAGQGREAAAEFQKILDHSGIVVNCPSGALARLGLARAYALQAGPPVAAVSDRREKNGAQRAPLQPGALAKARNAYQDFFTLWKDADPDIPILKQAKAEYVKLQ